MSMTVEEARERRVCRVCGEAIHAPGGPLALTLNYGEEFAHTSCLPCGHDWAPIQTMIGPALRCLKCGRTVPD